MEHYIDYIENLILNKKAKNERFYNHYIDISDSFFQNLEFYIYEIELEIESVQPKTYVSVKVYIKYYIAKCLKYFSRLKYCNNLKEAIKYIYSIPIHLKICHECCSLYKTECKSCLFFKGFGKLENCAICRETTYRTTLPCGHMFHKLCLWKMDRIDLKCPLCRIPVSTSFIQSLFKDDIDDKELEYNSDEEE